MAEALLEECLLENVTLLKNSTPLTEHSQPKLAQAKAHLDSILCKGRLEVWNSFYIYVFEAYEFHLIL